MRLATNRGSDGSVVILVDDTRSFADGRPCQVARTADDGLRLLRRYEFGVIDQLWLDTDLGWLPDSTPLTAQPVVDELVAAAEAGRPFSIGEIRIHGQNPAAATTTKLQLQRAGYRVSRHYQLRTLRQLRTLGQLRTLATPDAVDSGR